MGVGVDVGVDPQAGAGDQLQLLRQARDRRQLALRLDVEQPHRPAPLRVGRAKGGRRLAQRAEAPVERRPDLVVGLADAGEDDLGHRRAGQPGALQLAARDHVHAGAQLAQQPAEVQVGARLDGVAQARPEGREERLQTMVGVADGRGRVDVDRRARRLGDGGQGDAIGTEQPVAPGESGHCRSIATLPGPPGPA